MPDAVDRQRPPRGLVFHGPGVEPDSTTAAVVPAGELLHSGLERAGDLGRGLRVPERDSKRRRDDGVPSVGEQRQEQTVAQCRGGPGEGASDEVDNALGGPGARRGEEDGAARGLFFLGRKWRERVLEVEVERGPRRRRRKRWPRSIAFRARRSPPFIALCDLSSDTNALPLSSELPWRGGTLGGREETAPQKKNEPPLWQKRAALIDAPKR